MAKALDRFSREEAVFMGCLMSQCSCLDATSPFVTYTPHSRLGKALKKKGHIAKSVPARGSHRRRQLLRVWKRTRHGPSTPDRDPDLDDAGARPRVEIGTIGLKLRRLYERVP